MGHHVLPLLLVAVFGAAAAMAASGDDVMPPIPEFHIDIPPIPQPADIPPPSPCLNSLSPVCNGVSTQDSPNLAPCCTVFKKLFNNDPTCVCDAVVQAQKVAKEYKLNGTIYDGLETFRLCDMPTTSCEPGKPGEKRCILFWFRKLRKCGA
ncbi:hypothetical protein ACQ4PT_050969 [Festuca glaucescens]